MKSRWLGYVLDSYGVEPDHPFPTNPHTAVFRNIRTRKWFAVLLEQLPLRCLGLREEGAADVLNLKCDPIMTHSLIDNRRIFHAYHMNKEHWISVLLEGPVTEDELFFLTDLSYRLVDQAAKPRKMPRRKA